MKRLIRCEFNNAYAKTIRQRSAPDRLRALAFYTGIRCLDLHAVLVIK